MKKMIECDIDMQWLLYDILNETYLRGRTLRNGENYKEVAVMLASQDEENIEKILRSITNGIAVLKTTLSEYIQESGDDTNNTPIKKDAEIIIRIYVPGNFRESAVAGLSNMIHDYLKNLAIADWYAVTNKEESNEYSQSAQSALILIADCMNKRERPTKNDF